MSEKKAEQALQQSEARFKALVANSSDIITVLRSDGTVAFESPSAIHILGFAPEELVGRYVFDYIHPDDLPRVAKVFAEKIQQAGSTAAIEYRFRHANGSWIYLDSRATNLMDDPIIQGAVINSRDVTDRKRAEELLAKERLLLRTVIDQMPDNIYVKDLDSRFVLNNAASLETLGVARQEDLIGKSDSDFFAGEIAETWRAHEQTVMQTGHPMLEVEQFQPWRTDKRRWVVESTIPLRDEYGNVFGMLGVSRDISERKKEEEARYLSESRYRSLAENLPDSVVLLYDRTMRFVLVDGPEVERSGYSKTALEGKTIYEALPEDFVTIIEPNMQAVLQGNRFSAELPFADQVYLYHYVPLRNKQGEIIHGMILGLNITQRKQAEQALRDSDERYRQAVENSPNAIFVVDRQSRIQLWNPACRAVLLYDTDIIGHPYHELVDAASDISLLDSMVKQVFDGQALDSVDIAFRCRNGDIRYAVSRLYPVRDATGQVSQCVFANTDITARRQSEERLRASEEELRQLSDAALEGIAITEQGQIILANKRLAKMLGYEHSEISGRFVQDFVAPESRPMVLEHIKSGYEYGYEHLALRKDGVVFPVETQGKEMSYRGKLVRITSIRDISERKRAEESLRRSESFLRALLDATTDVAFLMSTEGTFLTANRATAESMGMAVETMVGLNGFELMNSELRLTRISRFDAVFRSGKPERFKDFGMTGWSDNTIYPVLAPSGSVEAYAVFSRDITEQKRLETELQRYTQQLEQMVEDRTAQLRRAKEQVETILDSSHDAIALTQPNGDIQLRNAAFVSLFGAPVAQSIERILGNVADSNECESVANALMKAIWSQESQRVEARIITQDSLERDVDLAFIPVRSAPGESQPGILVSAHDITYLKEVERFKERFVSNAVHDLATPIAGLCTRLYLLKRAPAQLDSHVLALENQVEHLRNLVTDLRTLSQLDRGQVSLELEPCDLNQLAARVFATYEPVAINRDQSLHLITDPALPQLPLDSRQIERVLVNLVSNAINYTPNGKTISIQTMTQGETLVLTVTDEGIGIEAEDLPHIFERFYRTSKARQMESAGTGLGLAIVKEIIDIHNGTIAVTSEPGHGSTFSVGLPITG